MKNLGPVSRGWLSAIGIHTLGELADVGSITAYRLIRQHGHRANLNLLYALEAALRGCHWQALDPATRASLQAAGRQIAAELKAG
ncbi:TfoX/Sxy family protein [Chitinimonas sp. BJYL2]|uniref:TfoX/Sxy family protein n=1 Tax=Chitinimonas sp. BJYL2 TaxID=2976696 RepID=UPI0022B5783E|nr:TfoX/Sxy family protein [Chitinimonas sp. BJYL2]